MQQLRWVDAKFLSCIKQLFFPRELWWKPWRTRALCLSSQTSVASPVPCTQGFALGGMLCAL